MDELATERRCGATPRAMAPDPSLRIYPVGPEGWRELRRQDRALLRLVAAGTLALALLWTI
jgi:hypothetical protein